jgi:hypothetical protein
VHFNLARARNGCIDFGRKNHLKEEKLRVFFSKFSVSENDGFFVDVRF